MNDNEIKYDEINDNEFYIVEMFENPEDQWIDTACQSLILR